MIFAAAHQARFREQKSRTVVHVNGRTDFFLFSGSKKKWKRRGTASGDLRNGLYPELREIDDATIDLMRPDYMSRIATFPSSFSLSFVSCFLVIKMITSLGAVMILCSSQSTRKIVTALADVHATSPSCTLSFSLRWVLHPCPMGELVFQQFSEDTSSCWSPHTFWSSSNRCALKKRILVRVTRDQAETQLREQRISVEVSSGFYIENNNTWKFVEYESLISLKVNFLYSTNSQAFFLSMCTQPMAFAVISNKFSHS